MPELAIFLHTHSDKTARWDLVTTSAMQASTLIADYDLSVMALGGFSGNDPTITVDQFADYVAAGEVRYVLANGAGPGAGPAGIFGGGQFPGNITRPGTGTNPLPGTQRNGFPGSNPGNRTFPSGSQQATPQQPPVTQNQQNATTAQQKGANIVMAAVRSVCTPVSGTETPAQYTGSLYDCAGAADRLHAYN